MEVSPGSTRSQSQLGRSVTLHRPEQDRHMRWWDERFARELPPLTAKAPEKWHVCGTGLFEHAAHRGPRVAVPLIAGRHATRQAHRLMLWRGRPWRVIGYGNANAEADTPFTPAR